MAVTITWTGHATFLVDTNAGVLLVDPFLDECPTSALKASEIEYFLPSFPITEFISESFLACETILFSFFISS